MRFFNKLVYYRKWRIVKEILAIYGVEIPKQVEIGRDFELVHRGFGTVLHRRTRIGDRVKIFHQVTIGRADGYLPGSDSKMGHVFVEDDVILFPGCKILAGDGDTRIGRGTVIAANAVLLNSTGEGEIWAGIPARRVSFRPGFGPDSPEPLNAAR